MGYVLIIELTLHITQHQGWSKKNKQVSGIDEDDDTYQKKKRCMCVGCNYLVHKEGLCFMHGEGCNEGKLTTIADDLYLI